MNKQPLPPLGVRLPEHLRNWLKAQAVLNGSSQNSEIVRAIRERMERTEGERPATR